MTNLPVPTAVHVVYVCLIILTTASFIKKSQQVDFSRCIFEMRSISWNDQVTKCTCAISAMLSTKPHMGRNVGNYWVKPQKICQSTGCSKAECHFLDGLKWQRNEIYITKHHSIIITRLHHFVWNQKIV